MAEGLTSYEEFRSSLGYFFTLFGQPFPAALEEAAQRQWASLEAEDAILEEDGGNNPLLELKLSKDFGAAVWAALSAGRAGVPSLQVPRTQEQVSFWRAQAASGDPEELSHLQSHFATIHSAFAWWVRSSTSVCGPRRVFVLGASARYEYVTGLPETLSPCSGLAEALAKVSQSILPDAEVEWLFCGRDVPPELHGSTTEHAKVRLRHFVGYFHTLVPAVVSSDDVKGSLVIALHGGLGLDHPELSHSWPPTVELLKHNAPVHFAISSFNSVENSLAESKLKALCPGQIRVDVSAVNEAGSLAGPDEIHPFDGLQGKRNYSLLLARVQVLERSTDGWELFE